MRLSKALPASILLMPAGCALGIFMILPLIILVVFSFGERDAFGRLVLGFSSNNYWRFFSGPYLTALWRSLMLASSTTVVCLFFGFISAIWLAFCVPRDKQGMYMTLLVAPLWTAFLLRIYAWMIILRPTGLLSSALKVCGWINPPIILYSPLAILLGMVYNYLPYMILPLYAALEKLDIKLLEAAVDLGATSWQTLIKVILPLSSRGIVAGIIMVFIPALGDYITPDLLGGAKTMFIGNLIQNQFLTVRNWAFGSAVSTILIVIVTAAVYVYLKYGDQLSIKSG